MAGSKYWPSPEEMIESARKGILDDRMFSTQLPYDLFGVEPPDEVKVTEQQDKKSKKAKRPAKRSA
jgi:hypothetical protein